MNKKLLFLPLMTLCLVGCATNARDNNGNGDNSGNNSQQGGGGSTGELVLAFNKANRTAQTDAYTWEKDGFKVTSSKGDYADDFTASAQDDHGRFYAASALKFECNKPIKKMVFKCWVWSGKDGAANLAAESWSVGNASAGEQYESGSYTRNDCTWTYEAGATTININKLVKQTRVEQVTVTF